MLQAGDEIDIWVVDRPLGQGGMGSVYRCHNREARRILAAVKVLDASIGRHPKAKARFVREAEILFSLDHPGIVKVRNVRMDLALPYLEMEFIDGVNLEERIQAGPTPAADALPWFLQVAEALTYLHAKGIRHRDIKPSNLLIQANGAIKIVDFGIATEAEGVTLTDKGQTFGSVSYAPPEWLDPERLDPVRWDVYSAGVVFWEVLVGRQAFPMGGDGSLQQQVLRVMSTKQRHPPLDPGPGAPRVLRELIREMTRPEWQGPALDAAAVLTRLRAVNLADLDQTAPTISNATLTWSPDAPPLVRPPAGRTMVPEDSPDPTWDDTAEAAREVEEVRQAVIPSARAPGIPGWVWGVAAAGVLAGVAVAAGWVFTRPPDKRTVDVTVTGVEKAGITLDAQAATSQEGGRFRFEGVAPGQHTLRAVVGDSCDGDAPWCARSEQTLTVEASADPLVVPWTLSPPAARELRFDVTGLATGTPVQARVDGVAIDGLAAPLAPGHHTVVVWTGTCSEADAGCSATKCPTGCSSWSGDVVLPVGDGAFTASVALVPPVAPVGQVRAASTEPSRPVTVGQFAKWLERHPEWQRDAALGAGTAKGDYLKGWTGATPPAGTEKHAVTTVSWNAAKAYCAGHGGLAPLDAPPLQWTLSDAHPWLELRDANGKPAWRGYDNSPSTVVKASDVVADVGFRCAR